MYRPSNFLIKLAQDPNIPLPSMDKGYGAGGAATGAVLGGALGAGIGDLIASQTHRNIFNIPIPGTQRLENNEGRLAGAAIGSLLGGLGGTHAGIGMAQKQKFEHAMELQRMQDRAEILRRMRGADALSASDGVAPAPAPAQQPHRDMRR